MLCTNTKGYNYHTLELLTNKFNKLVICVTCYVQIQKDITITHLNY